MTGHSSFFCLIFVLQGGDRQVHMCERWAVGQSGSLTRNIFRFYHQKHDALSDDLSYSGLSGKEVVTGVSIN